MDLSRNFFLAIFMLFSLSIFSGHSASSSISDGVYASQSSIGRNLLQNKKACPINFEFQNYSVITTQCRGPRYPPKLCCDAFAQFACPFVDYLNDLSSDCASTMFSYININGKYPPGLFAFECKGDKEGLPCFAQAPSVSVDDHSAALLNSKPSRLILFLAAFAILIVWFN